MATFLIQLPEHYDWEDVKFYDSAVWGTGNKGKNLWGWPKGAPLTVSAPEKCTEREHEWMLRVTIDRNPEDTEGFAFISRCELNDPNNKYGVFSSNQMILENL